MLIDRNQEEKAEYSYGIEPLEEGKLEHALLAKMRTTDGRTVIICGGINAEATRKLGQYVGRHRKKIVELQDWSNQTKVGARPFAVAFRVLEFDDKDYEDKDVSAEGVKVWMGEGAASMGA